MILLAIIILLVTVIIYNSLMNKETMVTVGQDTGNNKPRYNLTPQMIQKLGPDELDKLDYDYLTTTQIESFTTKQILYIYKKHKGLLPPKVEYLFGIKIKDATNEFLATHVPAKDYIYGVQDAQFKFTKLNEQSVKE